MTEQVFTKAKSTILIVDDHPNNLKILATVLNADYHLLVANSGEKALSILENKLPDLILLDVMMPHMDGYAVCAKIKSNQITKDIPIIFLTAKNDIDDIVKGFNLGAIDYITKPFNHTEIKVRINNHIESYLAKKEIVLMNAKLSESEKELTLLNNKLEKYSTHLEDLVEARTEELRNALVEVEKVNRLKTEIIANMNHEIKTPLNFIKGSVALLKILLLTDETDLELNETLDSLNHGVHRLSRTLELFSDLSALKSGLFKPNKSVFDLVSNLNHYYAKYAKLVKQDKENIRMTCQKSIEEAYTEADEQNTFKIVDFILDNAVKFTHDGFIKLSIDDIDDKYVVTIEDTGIGISDDYKSSVFEPFTQEDMSATRAYEGIGLSLALAHEYAKANDIELDFESQKGAGTKFYIKFHKYDIDESLL